MSDIDFVVKKLKEDAKKKRFAHVQVGTGLTQRTLENISQEKTQPSARTLIALLSYYKPAKEKK